MTYMKMTFFALMLLNLVACSSPQKSDSRKDINEVYIPSGAEQYFLPNLPRWANVSTAADCRRDQTIRFFDLAKLNQSYRLTYEQLMQFQLMFNHQLISQLKSLPPSVELRPRDEEVLFFNTLEKIQGGDKLFLAPDFKEINLIWVDDAVNDKGVLAKLKKLMSSEAMDQGFPVFISSCLSLMELEKFVLELGFPETSKMITAEVFTPFTTEFFLSTRTSVDVDRFFKDTQRLNLFTNREVIPKEIKGHFRYKKF